MAAAYNKFNTFVADVCNGLHNLASGAYYVMLTNSAPTATNTVYSNLTDLSTANGYTAGGTAVVITSSTQTGGTEKWLVAQLTVVTATGSVGPFRYAVLYLNSGGKPLVAWWDYGSSITLNSGDAFVVAFDQTNGVLQMT